MWSAILAIRHFAYDMGLLPSQKGALPTLVVGNAELGGTGKTPHVLDLVLRLQQMLGSGSVGILSRGYGRSSQEFRWVSDANVWQDVGDEPWMMQAALPNAAVAVGANRLKALERMATERPELRVVVLDDGLQHRSLRADRTVGLASRPSPPKGWGWARVLPSGPWRDLPSRLQSCDRVAATTPKALCWNPDWISHVQALPPQPALPQAEPYRENQGPWLLVTGVAQPQRVVDAAVGLGIDLAACAHYPDHHAFSPSEANEWILWMESQNVNGILTTHKDAVRLLPVLPDTLKDRLWVLPIEIRWSSPEHVDEFLKSWAQTLPSQSNRIF